MRDVAEPGERQVGAVFAALADPTRRRVVRVLAERRTVTASALADELPITRQAIAKHLAALAKAGLVTAEHEGRETRYRLTETGAEWDDRLDALARHLRRRRP